MMAPAGNEPDCVTQCWTFVWAVLVKYIIPPVLFLLLTSGVKANHEAPYGNYPGMVQNLGGFVVMLQPVMILLGATMEVNHCLQSPLKSTSRIPIFQDDAAAEPLNAQRTFKVGRDPHDRDDAVDWVDRQAKASGAAPVPKGTDDVLTL